jgi:hypothetical protein
MSRLAGRYEGRDIDWQIWIGDDGTFRIDQITVMVLMDIRQELRRLNRLLHCENFTAVPSTLSRIAANTKPKPKRKRRISHTARLAKKWGVE